jgi:hypothetical protein
MGQRGLQSVLEEYKVASCALFNLAELNVIKWAVFACEFERAQNCSISFSLHFAYLPVILS